MCVIYQINSDYFQLSLTSKSHTSSLSPEVKKRRRKKIGLGKVCREF